MLQSIRDRTHGWIAGTVISILILSFALWGISSYFLGGSANNVVAKVNGIAITKPQLASAYERLRKQLQMRYSGSYEIPEQAESNIKNRALQALINIQVLKQASISQGYRISSRQVDNFLESMPEFQVDGQFSYDRLQQILATTLFNANDFLDLIKTTLLIDQPRLGIIFTSYSLPTEVKEMVSLVNQERDIQYAMLPLQSKQAIFIPEDKILAYYQKHQEDFRTPEQVSIQYIELSKKELANSTRPTDEAVKAFYDENINSFALPAQWKLDSLFLPLKEGASDQEVNQASEKISEVFEKAKSKSFSSLASEYSLKEADENFKKGIMLNQVSTDLQKVLLKLTKPGQVSEPIRTNQGFLLLKLLSLKEAEVQPFSTIKAKVKEAYIRQQVEEKFADFKEKLSSVAYEHPDSLEPVATTLHLSVKSAGPFTKEKGNKEDITANNKIREAAFSNDVLNLQNNSDAIQVGDTIVVVRVKSHELPALLSLKTVRDQIINKLTAQEADSKTELLANEITHKLSAGANQDQIAKQYNLTWNSTGFIGRHSTKVNSVILDTAFSMPQPKEKNTSYGDVKVSGGGYAIIALKAVRDGNLSQQSNENIFAEQTQNAQGVMEYELYKQSLMKQAKIVIEN